MGTGLHTQTVEADLPGLLLCVPQGISPLEDYTMDMKITSLTVALGQP